MSSFTEGCPPVNSGWSPRFSVAERVALRSTEL
jgi:hypothetical protein